MSEVIEGLEEPALSLASVGMSALSKAELDIQITTAKAYKRSVKKFYDDALSMATINEEVAGGCFYAIPRDGKTIEGPSIRMAEIVANAWSNLHAATRIKDDDGKFITAEAVVWDLERNVRLGFEVRRRVTDRNGRRFKDDMVLMTMNAAMAIAFRNAVFKVVPSAFTRPIFNACRRVAVGDAQTLSARRDEALKYCSKHGVIPERVFAALGVTSELDIDLDRLATLRGLITAIGDGDTTIDDAFPDPTGAKAAEEKRKAKENEGKPAGGPEAAAQQLRSARLAGNAGGETVPFVATQTPVPGPASARQSAALPEIVSPPGA